MEQPKKTTPPRDDAETQPESGYPSGRLPTAPSTEPSPEEIRRDSQVGSEAEFDSLKKRD